MVATTPTNLSSSWFCCLSQVAYLKTPSALFHFVVVSLSLTPCGRHGAWALSWVRAQHLTNAKVNRLPCCRSLGTSPSLSLLKVDAYDAAATDQARPPHQIHQVQPTPQAAWFCLRWCLFSNWPNHHFRDDLAYFSVCLKQNQGSLSYIIQAYCGDSWLTLCSDIPSGWEQHTGAFDADISTTPPAASSDSDASSNYLVFGGYLVDDGTLPSASTITGWFSTLNAQNVEFDMEGDAVNYTNWSYAAARAAEVKAASSSAKIQMTGMVACLGCGEDEGDWDGLSNGSPIFHQNGWTFWFSQKVHDKKSIDIDRGTTKTQNGSMETTLILWTTLQSWSIPSTWIQEATPFPAPMEGIHTMAKPGPTSRTGLTRRSPNPNSSWLLPQSLDAYELYGFSLF